VQHSPGLCGIAATADGISHSKSGWPWRVWPDKVIAEFKDPVGARDAARGVTGAYIHACSHAYMLACPCLHILGASSVCVCVCVCVFACACLHACPAAHHLARRHQAAGRVQELAAASAEAALAHGIWLVLLEGSSPCKKCREIRKSFAKISSDFKDSVSLAVLLEGAKRYKLGPGSVLLFVGQGHKRYVEYTEGPADAEMRHFLWYYIGEAEVSQNRHEAAVRAYKLALEAKSVAEVHGKLASVLHQNLRDLSAAVLHYDLALAPRNGVVELKNEWYASNHLALLCVCVCVCARARARVCVYSCMCVCVHIYPMK
jgi:hypothetical protein